MYRQIRVADEDAMFQRIIWRSSPNESIKDYELVTVTFGTASAPYLAVRTLHQIAYDEGDEYPLVAEKVLRCYYMDDLMTGCDDVTSGFEIYKQMKELLAKGGFELQKWSTNNKELLEQINTIEHKVEKNKENESKAKDRDQKELEMKLDNTMKILGLTWDRNEDSFQYTVQLPPLQNTPAPKRTVISDIYIKEEFIASARVKKIIKAEDIGFKDSDNRFVADGTFQCHHFFLSVASGTDMCHFEIDDNSFN